MIRIRTTMTAGAAFVGALALALSGASPAAAADDSWQQGTRTSGPSGAAGCVGSGLKARVCFDPTGDKIYVYDGDADSAPAEELQHLAGRNRAGGNRLPHATVSRVLRGQAQPSRDLLLALVEACGEESSAWARAGTGHPAARWYPRSRSPRRPCSAATSSKSAVRRAG